MSMIDDLKKASFTAVALGAGVLSLLPAVLPVAARGVRPLLNSAIQGGLVCLEKGQEAVAEIHRILDQVAAESEAARYGTRGAMAANDSGPVTAATGEPDPEAMG
ncbi:MAG TPA: hypothetical protein VFF03_13175 [Rhodocyclaceae bacterium]|nr:hypothetical protein [Rhodocyclaceae bacterium]